MTFVKQSNARRTAVESKSDRSCKHRTKSRTRSSAGAETAVNIGYSCRLLKEEMEEVYVVDGETATEVRRQLQDAVDDMDEKSKDEVDGMPPTMQQRQQQQQQGWQDTVGLWRRNRVNAAAQTPAVGADISGFALVINGSSLVSLVCSDVIST